MRVGVDALKLQIGGTVWLYIGELGAEWEDEVIELFIENAVVTIQRNALARDPLIAIFPLHSNRHFGKIHPTVRVSVLQQTKGGYVRVSIPPVCNLRP
jgi:hypothetical protein